MKEEKRSIGGQSAFPRDAPMGACAHRKQQVVARVREDGRERERGTRGCIERQRTAKDGKRR